MARGGRAKDRRGPERRCIVTGESGPTARLIRFTLSPDGDVVPDLAGRLPGRGVWLSAEWALIDKAVKRKLFSRAFRAPVKVPEGLSEILVSLLARRLVETISMARKAGQAVTGFEKVRSWLAGGAEGVVITASDAAADGRAKLARLASEHRRIEVLDSAELGLAFGRDFAIHAALDAGGIAERAMADADRLAGFRAGGSDETARRHVSAQADG